MLKAPYNYRKGCYGIKAVDVANLTIGVALAGKTNYFDAIMSGIHLTKTNAVLYNNRFQNLLGYSGLTACLVPHVILKVDMELQLVVMLQEIMELQ